MTRYYDELGNDVTTLFQELNATIETQKCRLCCLEDELKKKKEEG